MKAEYPNKRSCPQKDSAEHEEYVGAQSVGCREIAEQDGADMLEKILHRDNLNRAYKRVRANKGALGIDGMTIEDALLRDREHEDNDAKMGRVAEKETPCLYLETMEDPESENP